MTRWADLKTGLFVSVALFLLFITLFISAPLSALFHPGTYLYVKVDNVGGLRVDASVLLDGFQIGTLKRIGLAASGGELLRVKIGKSYIRYIYRNAYAQIEAPSFVGSKVIAIYRGDKQCGPVKPGDTIPAVIVDPMRDVNKVLASASGVAGRVDSMITSIEHGKGTLGQLVINPELYDRLTLSVSQMAELLTAMQHGNGSFSHIVNDSLLYHKLIASVNQVGLLLDSARNGSGTSSHIINDPTLYQHAIDAVDRVSVLIEQIQAGPGPTGTAISNKPMADDMRNVVKDLDLLIQDVKKNPRRYFSIHIF